MAIDVGADLLSQITDAFAKRYDDDITIRVLEKRLASEKATLEDAMTYAERVGEILANVYQETLSSSVLPNGKMYWNIAQKVIKEPLVQNYTLAANASMQAVEATNKRYGVNIKAQKPTLGSERISNIANKVVQYDSYDDAAYMLGEPVKNFSRSVVDDAVHENADFQAKAGIDVKIVRTTTGRDTCNWCRARAGTYDYETVRATGSAVWQRHDYCDCRIEYVSEKERYDVENFKKPDKRRREVAAENDRSAEKIAARKALAGIGEAERANKKLRRDNPEIVVDWQTLGSKAYRNKFNAISDNEALNENLLKASKEILKHRSGTLQEDIYLLDADSGEIVYKQTSSTEKQAVSYPEKMKKLIKANPGRFITLHNHPKGRPPSAADINSQYVNKYREGVVCTHDGRVFVYEVGEGFDAIEPQLYNFAIAKQKKLGYNETEAQIRALKELLKNNNFSFREV